MKDKIRANQTKCNLNLFSMNLRLVMPEIPTPSSSKMLSSEAF